MGGQTYAITERFSIEELVKQPSWREVLIELVEKHQLDPWRIDIVDITSTFLLEVRKMKELNLSIPANIILASAILLRFKSVSIRDELTIPILDPQTLITDSGFEVPVMPEINIATRFPPKRMVTMEELITMVDTVMDRIKKRSERTVMVNKERIVELKIEGYDIEKEMERIIAAMNELKDDNNMLLFSSLGNLYGNTNSFLPLLYLRYHNRITMMQEEFFGEIIINMIEGKDARKEEE